MRESEFPWFIGAFYQRTPKRSSRAHLLTLTLAVSNLTNVLLSWWCPLCSRSWETTTAMPSTTEPFATTMEETAVSPPSRPRRLVVPLEGRWGGGCWICSDLQLLFAPRPWGWERTPPRTFFLRPLAAAHPSGVAIFSEPWRVNDRLNLREVSAVCWNHNWV